MDASTIYYVPSPSFSRPDTHRKLIGYGLWLVGFTGAHRFYYGRPLTGGKDSP